MATLTKPRPPKKTGITVEEYFALPPDELHETLLIYGKLIMSPKPKRKHNRAIIFLGALLDLWVEQMKLGMMFFDNDLVLDEEKALVYAPDMMFLAKENEGRIRDELVYGPVDLAVEILSPSEHPYLQNRKYTDYERYGIPWFWIIDPRGEEVTLEEHQLIAGRYECRTEIVGDQWFEPGLFPGLVFRLASLLEGDLKAAVKGKARKLV